MRSVCRGGPVMTELLFGINVSTSAAPGRDPVADAQVAEGLGFDFVSASDHPAGTQPTFETWTLLAWMAAATHRIRLASRVLGVPFRPPALVAKMAESLDRLSGGRLILGLGGGASNEELRAFGVRAPSDRDKVDGLDEAIRVMRGVWTQPTFSFEGRHYRTDHAELEPKPARAIPVWLGTFGNRALAVTGRLADGWIPSLQMAPPERVPAMRDRLFAAALEAGRQEEDITCVYNMQVRVDPNGDARPHVVSGSVDAVVERLLAFVELGFSAMNFLTVGPDEHEQAHRLALEVIPAVRAAA
jgi:probable F420-dependent oxidoreductase